MWTVAGQSRTVSYEYIFLHSIQGVIHSLGDWVSHHFQKQSSKHLYFQNLNKGPDIFREGSPPPTCHASCVTCHMSHVMCHVSHVKYHNYYYFFVTKWWSLSVEGVLSTGPTRSSLGYILPFRIVNTNTPTLQFIDWTGLWANSVKMFVEQPRLHRVC